MVLLVMRGDLQLGVDSRVKEEYHEVLTRGKFRLNIEWVGDFLSALLEGAQDLMVAPVAGSYPDEDDRMFVEVAVAFQAQALVTWNIRHYRAARKLGLRVMTPPEFLRWWARR